MQLRKDSLFVTIGDATLKLKHGANRIKEFLLLGWLKFPESVGDVLNQIWVQLCCWNSSSLPSLRVCFLFLFPSQLNQKLRQSEFVTITKLLQIGIDIGVVISDRANLRDGPSTTNPAIRELQRGELFVLLSRVPLGPWYRVIHVKSGLEGWINGNTIRVRYTEKPKPPPVFQERETGSYENPDIEITNDSDKTLYLRVGDDDRIVIHAHSTQTITKPAGTYWFYAVCPGVLPAFGERRFEIGFMYTWRFYIVSTY